MESNREFAVCTVSGGFDSAAALLDSLQRYPKVKGLFVDYGQPYLAAEVAAVRYLVHEHAERAPAWAGLRILRAPLLSSPRAEDGAWIPYRNLILAALATNWAVGWGAGVVVLGSKSVEWRPDDPISYRDSTAGFYEALEHLVWTITEPVRAPYQPRYTLPCLGWTKRQVLEYLKAQGVALRALWNCYGPGPQPDGTCPHCRETQPLVTELEGVVAG